VDHELAHVALLKGGEVLLRHGGVCSEQSPAVESRDDKLAHSNP
jgi:hypothetical protein